MMKEYTKRLLPFAALLLCLLAAWLSGFFLMRIHYRAQVNRETAQLYQAVHDKYPLVSDAELLAVLRGEGPAADAVFLQTYGYDGSRLSSAGLARYEKALLFYGLGGLVMIGLACALFLLAQYRRHTREAEEMIRYIQDINRGIYDLKIDENTEARASLLSNELYRITSILKEAAERSRKETDALNRSLQDISHQLKTPLTSMRIMLDNIADNPDMPAEMQADFLHSISQQVDRISALVVSLLHLARFDSGVIRMQPEALPIGSLLDEVLEELSIMAEVRGISFQTEGPTDTVISLDRRWEAEALRNIVKNCLEHSPGGSVIHLKVEDSSLFLKLTIRDEGEGIAPEDLHHIFERFYKAKNSASDSIGIGLSFAKAIIENDNGMIHADSVLGEGTVFVIRWKK